MNAPDNRSLYESILEAVGPVRAAAFGILYQIGRGSIVDKSMMAALSAADAMLDHDMDRLMNDADAVAAKALEEARKKALEQLRAFMAASENAQEEGEEVRIEDLAVMVQVDLEPAISEFLAEMRAHIESQRADEFARQREIVDTAIGDIEMINSTINLIAVNASVEAALAGDAGKGFAIIAAEIQNLSQRSKKIVEEIRTNLD